MFWKHDVFWKFILTVLSYFQLFSMICINREKDITKNRLRTLQIPNWFFFSTIYHKIIFENPS